MIEKEILTRLYNRYILPFLKISNFSLFCDNYGNILNNYLNYDFHYSLTVYIHYFIYNIYIVNKIYEESLAKSRWK